VALRAVEEKEDVLVVAMKKKQVGESAELQKQA